LKRRGRGERRCVTGDNMMMMMKMMSPKTDIISLYEKKRSGLLQNEASYKADINKNCRISEHKTYSRPVCEYC
jgi:hypothetical protein